MIIQDQVKDLYIVGEDTSKKATISADKMAKLQYLLTKGLYKDPITAVIAEWTNNGVDSIVESGKNPVENPVIVIIGKNDKGQYIFSVEDKGVGLDNNDFENICMNYLESTKEGNNDTIGHFGIGMKSFLSLERSATFTCRKNGKERIYNVYEGAEFVNYDLIIERDTTEENGVKAELIISGYSERSTFMYKARQKLAYYDTAVLIIDDTPVKNTIYRNDLFQWSSENSNSYMHLSLKDVYYTIDWEALGISQINLPIALRFDLSSGITPTPSRESYITNEITKSLILNKIKEVADWFVNKYNETVVEFDNFVDGYEFYGESTYRVNIEGKEFVINPITSLSSVAVKNHSVKGISIREASFYKSKRTEFFHDFSMFAYRNPYKGWQTKRLHYSIANILLVDKGKVVIIGGTFSGYLREYLKEKYDERYTLFVRNDRNKRKLWNPKYGYYSETFERLLNLDRRDKSSWRKNVEEWLYVENSLKSLFIDERDVENSDEFKEWVEQRKEELREKRKLGIQTGTYQVLNKQLGDVTLAYSYTSIRGISFRKATYKIADLPKNKYLTVLISPDDDIERAKELLKGFKNSTIRWALVGNNEIKKVPNKQFIKFKDFMTRDCKPFMRLATSILFRNLLTDFDKISHRRNELFKKFLSSYVEASTRLRQYHNENYTNRISTSLENIILDVAYEKDLFDKILWSEYMYVKEGIEKYDWITCLEEPSIYSEEETKKYNKIISQILLFRKKYYNEFPENAVIVFEEKPVEEDVEKEEGEFDVNGEVEEDDYDEMEVVDEEESLMEI